MKEIFDPYVLWPFDKTLMSCLVTRFRTCDYTVITFWNFASFKDTFETQEDENADNYFSTNGIPAALIEGALALVNENILPIENSALHLRLKLMKVASTFVSNWLMNNKYYCVFLTEIKHHWVE